jgi:acyl-coenzyme A synthetase/AMP-(fatty) acid ligase
VFPGVPTVYSTLVNTYNKAPFTLPSVTRVTNTAAALPADYIPTLKKIFPNALIFKMYGLTECKRVCYLEPELIDSHSTSVGKAIPGTQVMLLGNNMQPVAAHEEGILYVRGAHVMQGYWNKPEQTREMLIAGIVPDEEVLCTHDRFTRDEDGFLYFRGRTDDIIKARGEKVSPVEVENALHSISGVREAAVIGIPDPVEGEYIKAFVSLEPGCDLQPRQLRQHCIAKLENFMVPREVVIMDELPKTDSNKISKKALK